MLIAVTAFQATFQPLKFKPASVLPVIPTVLKLVPVLPKNSLRVIRGMGWLLEGTRAGA